MRSLLCLFVLAAAVFAADPREAAEQYLRKAASESGLSNADLAGVYISREFRTDHNAVTHITFRQRFENIEVYNAVYKINLDAEGNVLSAGGNLAQRPDTAPPSLESGQSAARAAIRDVRPELDGSYLGAPVRGEKYMRFARGGFGNVLEGEPVWYRDGNSVRAAWVFYVAGEDGSPNLVIADAASSKILFRRNTRQYQVAQGPRGLVFERESPQPNPTPGIVSPNRLYVERTLQPFTGDRVASPRGWVENNQTAGNNAIVGMNNLGLRRWPNVEPVTAPDGNFSFPLQLGPGAPTPTLFAQAAATNLFYWTNRAHDSLYAAGFDEAAGNFQQDNFGRGGVPGDPMYAYVHFGIAANAAAAIDNAFFDTNREFEDGARVSINMFLSGSRDDRVFTDGAYDAEVIVHEYAHGVSARLIDDYWTVQTAAMGEGWSDFWGLEFTVPEGSPPDGAYTYAEYLFQDFGVGIRTRPYSTDMSVNPLTYEQLGRVGASGAEVHDDGEIWTEALWEARWALIKQFGEREGRRRMRLLVMDGLKMTPPAPSMVQARDAILLADRVGFRGESQMQLWTAFAKRGLGATAHSRSANSVNVTASFKAPDGGAALSFERTAYSMGERVGVILYDPNLKAQTATVQLTTSSGDLEHVVLRKNGETFQGYIQSYEDGAVLRADSALDVIPHDYVSVYYLEANAPGGARLLQATAPVTPGYSIIPQPPRVPFTSGREQSLFALAGGRQLLTHRALQLPFAFPFFGRTYRTVYVAGDGAITFDVPLPGGCNDAASIASYAMIAPMHMELAYGGRAQPNENVFVSGGPGSVTVRWAAETTQTGEPVNFSVVLYDDGRIMFQYGAGNNNLVNSPFFGCNTNAPFVGISKGSDGYVLPYGAYTGSPYLELAEPVIFDPPFNYSSFPVVRLESPEPGSLNAGVVTLRGIAYDPNDAIARLDIIIDGVPRRAFRPNVNRSDVCGTERLRNCPTIGFDLSLDLGLYRILPGEHTLIIRATNTRGAVKDYPEQPLRFTVVAGQSRQPVGKIELPEEGATLSGNATIRGWAYAPDLRISAVDILVDGVTYGQAQYGLPRTDVCNVITGTRPPNCPNVGFTFTLNTAAGQVQLPSGAHSLQIRVRDESGRYTFLPETAVNITVRNESTQAPTGVITSPQPNARLSGVVKIWGWAWDPDGTVRTASLLVDGVNYATLRYGADRAEQCATMPQAPAACPNIGFEGDFDTSLVPNGVHSIGVVLVDDKGRTTVIPRLGAYGMNVVIAN